MELSDGSINKGDWWRIVETDAGRLRNIGKSKVGRQEQDGKILQSVLCYHVLSCVIMLLLSLLSYVSMILFY